LTATWYEQVEVLNASANSWGPRNELAYLQRFGTFNAQVVVLVINTDDLFATAPTSVPVGSDRNYPSHKPLLAIVEAITRFLPYQPPPEMAVVNAEKGDRVGFNLEAIHQIQGLAQGTGAQFLLAMTPLLREVNEPGPRDYELKARSRLNDFVKDRQIPYIDFLPTFKGTATPETLYRDHIHLSLQGSQIVSQAISSLVVSY
ncbi:MAG TPA: lipolytic protein G-D-S-L family, partial [Cyanobacteria bacterium UBA9273]|nr:lipolytic protein G-D-S-L family [Cyanobacteria bacterium UBA9273]